jgi:hypothetical protein
MDISTFFNRGLLLIALNILPGTARIAAAVVSDSMDYLPITAETLPITAETLPITAETLPGLAPIAEFACGDDSFSPQGVAILGDEIAFSCKESEIPFAIGAISTGKVIGQFETEQRLVVDLTWLDNGTALLADIQDEVIRIDRETQAVTHRIEKMINSEIAVSPDGALVALITEAAFPGQPDGPKVMVIDTATLSDVQFVHALPEDRPNLTDLAFGLRGDHLLLGIGQVDTRLYVYDLTEDTLLIEPERTPFVFLEAYGALVFSPDGENLLVSQCTYAQMGCAEGALSRIDLTTGETTQTAVFPDRFWEMVYAVDGSLIFALSYARIDFLDAETLEIVEPPFEMPWGIGSYQLALSPDGRFLAALEDRERFIVYGVPE